MSNNDRGRLVTSKMHKSYRKFFRQMGIRNIYEVPIRKSGMTGSGEANECHSNVGKLQRTYGGKVVLGFIIRQRQNNGLSLHHHSVWSTPEGNWVDVTLNWFDDDVVMFAPVKEYDANNTVWKTCNFIVDKNYKKKGLVRKEGSQIEHTRFSPVISMSNMFKKCPPEDRDSKGGGFTRPSSATGKSWDEIWSRTCNA